MGKPESFTAHIKEKSAQPRYICFSWDFLADNLAHMVPVGP